MTQSVADQTPIPDKIWRRHTDPPGLWFGVVAGSVVLHLLLFWLMRSYLSNLLWSQQQYTVVPIEFVDISSQAPSKQAPSKQAPSKAKPVSQKLQPAPPPPPKKLTETESQEKPSTTETESQEPDGNNDAMPGLGGAIAFPNKRVVASKPDAKILKQSAKTPTVIKKTDKTKNTPTTKPPTPTPSPKPVAKLTPTPSPKPTPTPIANKPTPTPSPKPTPKPIANKPTPTPSPKPTPKPIANKPTPTPSPKPVAKPTPTPSPKPVEDKKPTKTPSKTETDTPPKQQPASTEQNNTKAPTNTPPFDEQQNSPTQTNGGETIGQAPKNQAGETPRIDKTPLTPSNETPRTPGKTPPTPSNETPQTPGKTPPTPSNETPQTPGKTPTSPSNDTPETPTGGGLVANWNFLSTAEQKTLMRNPPPEGLILPEHIGNQEKPITSLFINQEVDLQPVEFLASLVIDKNGNFVQAEVIDPKIPSAQRDKYEQFANEVFRGEKFQPARYPDNVKLPPGVTTPDLTNRFVYIKIQRRSP